MINEVNRGNGITQLVEWPEEMEIRRIHVRRKKKVEESPLDDILFILSVILFTIVFVFAVPLVQWSELAFLLLVASAFACGMAVSYRAGKKRGR
jgi:hypothetical protein